MWHKPVEQFELIVMATRGNRIIPLGLIPITSETQELTRPEAQATSLQSHHPRIFGDLLICGHAAVEEDIRIVHVVSLERDASFDKPPRAG